MAAASQQRSAVPAFVGLKGDLADADFFACHPLVKGGYRLSTLTALALRSHGGAEGHEAHLSVLSIDFCRRVSDVQPAMPFSAKLAERAKKAKATRQKNGTDRVKKPRATQGAYSFLEQMLSRLTEEELDAFYEEMDDEFDSEAFYSDEYNDYDLLGMPYGGLY